MGKSRIQTGPSQSGKATNIQTRHITTNMEKSNHHDQEIIKANEVNEIFKPLNIKKICNNLNFDHHNYNTTKDKQNINKVNEIGDIFNYEYSMMIMTWNYQAKQ